MFTELDTMQHNNPHGYIQLIKSMRDGNFDKPAPDDSPTQWYTHFSNLLAKNTNTLQNKYFDEYFGKNIDQFITNLDNPFSIEELQIALKDLKNNKTSSFDKITNEILKVSGLVYKGAFLHLFNSISKTSFYPSLWKKDILSPIHKSDEKDDPNNFRGISLSSCLGKLFTKMLTN